MLSTAVATYARQAYAGRLVPGEVSPISATNSIFPIR